MQSSLSADEEERKNKELIDRLLAEDLQRQMEDEDEQMNYLVQKNKAIAADLKH